MPGVALNVKGAIGIRDNDADGIGFLIELALHCQASFGRRRGDQINDRDAADERLG